MEVSVLTTGYAMPSDVCRLNLKNSELHKTEHCQTSVSFQSSNFEPLKSPNFEPCSEKCEL